MRLDNPLSDLTTYLEQVRAIARTGLAFNHEGYDFQRYQELLILTARIEARLGALSDDERQRLLDSWRGQVSTGRDGYVTTAVGCGGIVFDQNDDILLIERADGGWWYPSGWCDVGYLPADVVIKEVREETGLIVQPDCLIGVFDSRLDGAVGRHYIVLLFYCILQGGHLEPDPLETRAAGFFPLDALPRPFHLPNPRWLEIATKFHFDRLRRAHFDRI